jgi:ribosomal protein S19E (S16A)
MRKSRGHQKGHPKYGGRKKGTVNRFGGDLREAVVAGIQAVGFIEKDKKGRRKRGLGGVQGFIECGDLREAVVAGIQATGFIEKHKKGRPVATGRGGCIGTIDAWT